MQFRKLGERTGPGSGRPTKLYTAARDEVSASIPPRHYDLAAGLLAAAVQRSIDSGANIADALAQVAFEEGMRLGAAAADIHQLLADTGYNPEPDGAGGTIMANCPFHRLARDHTRWCAPSMARCSAAPWPAVPTRTTRWSPTPRCHTAAHAWFRAWREPLGGRAERADRRHRQHAVELSGARVPRSRGDHAYFGPGPRRTHLRYYP